MKKIIILSIVLFSLHFNSALFAQEKRYSVDDFSIKNAYNLEKTKHPKVSPQWPKGRDSLNKYMNKHLDLSGIKLDLYTHRITIGFKVNKDGTINEFKFISSDSGKVAHRALDMLKKMKGWIPATIRRDEKVDCYTKAIFSINYNRKMIQLFKNK